MKPRIGVFAGDPTGIGPELTGKLLALPETAAAADVVPVGTSPRHGEYQLGKLSAAAGLAMPLPAMSKAVPCAGVVMGNARPP